MEMEIIYYTVHQHIQEEFFDKNLATYGGWWAFNYIQANGYYAYNGSNVNSYIEDSYKGDWVFIKFPTELILTRYKFRFSTATRAPGLFRFYGSIDGINFTQIVEASNDTIPLVSGYYPSSIYEKILIQHLLLIEWESNCLTMF